MTVIFECWGRQFIVRGDWNGLCFINGTVREVFPSGREGPVVNDPLLWRNAAKNVMEIYDYQGTEKSAEKRWNQPKADGNDARDQ